MWKLALAFSLISAPAFAAGLIQIPNDAVKVGPSTGAPLAPGVGNSPLSGVLGGGSGVDNSDDLPKWLDGASQAEYERFFNTLIYFQKQSAMATKASKIPPIVGVNCLPNKGAFAFERVSELDYKMNCWAGAGKKITHVAEYRMNVTFIPTGCATEAKIHEQFSNAANRNRKAAAEFYNMVKKVCIIQADAANHAQPVVKVTPVTTDFVTKSLEQNADLDQYVNGSHASKKEDVDYETEADAKKPAKKPVKKDWDEEDDSDIQPPAKKKSNDDAACSIPGNIYCSKSAQ